MSRHPAFKHGVGYGDRFDAEILSGLQAGQDADAIAESIGIGKWFVSKRARLMGYRSANKPPLQRRPDFDPDRIYPWNGKPSKLTVAVLAGRRNEGPSRLVRALRHRLVVLDRDGLDPSHGVACLHLAGLTLPEIERLTGVPAPAVIAAVRQHNASLGAEARS